MHLFPKLVPFLHSIVGVMHLFNYLILKGFLFCSELAISSRILLVNLLSINGIRLSNYIQIQRNSAMSFDKSRLFRNVCVMDTPKLSDLIMWCARFIYAPRKLNWLHKNCKSNDMCACVSVSSKWRNERHTEDKGMNFKFLSSRLLDVLLICIEQIERDPTQIVETTQRNLFHFDFPQSISLALSLHRFDLQKVALANDKTQTSNRKSYK